MAIAGGMSAFVILVDALLVICLALCFAELAGKFKENGGAYIYAREAFGEFVGFEVGLMKWFVNIISWAALANALATVVGSLWPAMASSHQIIVATSIISLSLVNYLGVDLAKYINNLSTVGKLLPLFAIVLFGIFTIDYNHTMSFISQSVRQGFPEGGSFAAAVLLMFYAFTGFESLYC